MQYPYLILTGQGRHNGACRVIVAILAPIEKLSERRICVLPTYVQAVEQSVNIAGMGEENVTVILTKSLMVDTFDWGNTVAGISRACRGGTAEQTKVRDHGYVYSPMTTNFSGSDLFSRSGLLHPNVFVTYCTL